MSHLQVAELLPWYANATLPEAERRAVEDHLRSCPECAQEVAQLRELQAVLLQIGESEPLPSPSAIVRARAAIEGPRRGWWTALPLFARVALAAQLVVIVGLAALLLARGPAGGPFHTVGGPSTPAGAGPGRATIVLGFAEGVSEPALRRTITGIGGSIVAGPSSSGLYTVELPFPPERDAEIEAVLRRLREARTVVRWAARRF